MRKVLAVDGGPAELEARLHVGCLGEVHKQRVGALPFLKAANIVSSLSIEQRENISQ